MRLRRFEQRREILTMPKFISVRQLCASKWSAHRGRGDILDAGDQCDGPEVLQRSQFNGSALVPSAGTFAKLVVACRIHVRRMAVGFTYYAIVRSDDHPTILYYSMSKVCTW